MPVLADHVPQENLESVGCALCGSQESSILFEIRHFPIRQCRACGARYVSPRLRTSSLIEMYSQESYYRSASSLVHGYVDYEADKYNIERTFRRRLAWVLSETHRETPGRLLDVGCALGYAVEYALGQGWDAYGIEPSAYAAEGARKRLAGRIVIGTLDRHPYPANHFDTILLWDVIEHVPDPLNTLRQAFDLLAPGGILTLITPDCGSLLAKTMGRFWMEYAKPTEHIHFFSRKTMARALEKTGFQVTAGSSAGKYVGLDFILDRLSAYLSVFRPLRTRFQKTTLSQKLFYINPLDKMHLVAVKPGR